MLGSTSPRMMRIGLPHVDLWNAWWSDYDNSVPGFARLRAEVERAAEAAGPRSGEVGATAAVLVQLEGGVGRTMGDGDYNAPVAPVRVTRSHREHLLRWRGGAVHVQLVLDPSPCSRSRSQAGLSTSCRHDGASVTR
jgi:hypothetical protein